MTRCALALALILAAAAGQVQANPPGVTVVLSPAVSGGEPVGRIAELTSNARRLCIHVTLKSVTESHRIRWEVVRPDGSVFRKTEAQTPDPGQQRYFPRFVAWACVTVPGDQLALHTGRWTARVVLDGNPVRALPFNVSPQASL